MVQGKATVTIDLGNSGTRVRVSCSQGAGKPALKRIFDLSNRFASIEEGYTISPDYPSDTSTVLIMDEDFERGILKDSRFVNGELALKEFYDAVGKPTALEKKFNSKYAKLSYQLAMLHACKTIMQLLKVPSFEELGLSLRVVVLLPPGDLDEGSPIMREMINSMKVIRFAYPEVTLNLNIEKVGVFAEGFCAYVGTVFNEDFSVRRGYEDVAQDTTLIIDIGAGTTDTLIVQGNKIVQKTRNTISLGGNQVTSKVRSRVKAELGGRVSEVAISESMVTGQIKNGSLMMDISGIIREEKGLFAKNIVSEISEFFEETMFPVNDIGRVLVCGGGAINVELSGSKTEVGNMADGILSFLKRVAPNVQLVPLPVVDIIVCNEGGEPEKSTGIVSPRLLNLIGGSILADM